MNTADDILDKLKDMHFALNDMRVQFAEQKRRQEALTKQLSLMLMLLTLTTADAAARMNEPALAKDLKRKAVKEIREHLDQERVR